MVLMTDLMAAIRAALGAESDLHTVDLYEVAEIVHRAFPDYSLRLIAFEVAKVAVERGCRYFIREPSS